MGALELLNSTVLVTLDDGEINLLCLVKLREDDGDVVMMSCLLLQNVVH